MELKALELFEEPITFIPRGWAHYLDNVCDFYYNPEEYEILYDASGKAFCHYVSKSDMPSQPIGITSCFQMFALYDGEYLDLSRWDFSDIIDFTGGIPEYRVAVDRMNNILSQDQMVKDSQNKSYEIGA